MNNATPAVSSKVDRDFLPAVSIDDQRDAAAAAIISYYNFLVLIGAPLHHANAARMVSEWGRKFYRSMPTAHESAVMANLMMVPHYPTAGISKAFEVLTGYHFPTINDDMANLRRIV